MSNNTDFECIHDLRGILKNVVSNVSKINISRLTAPGENYGSLMLKLDVNLEGDSDNEEEILRLVAKKIPIEEMLRENFNVQVTFKNEVAYYGTVVPTLQVFQRKYGMSDVFDSVPKFYGARLNLDGSDRVTEDAVLILENLVSKGYSNVDRITGFNLESTKLILRDLAEFHAIPLALKLKQPEVFEEKVKKYCNTFVFNTEFSKIFWDITRVIIRENLNCALLDEKIFCLGEIKNPEVSEPFATLVHADLWSNNTMQKFVDDQVAVENKFLDFQFLAYGSPASDFLFFVFSSVQLDVLKNHLDDLISTYHTYFVNILDSFDIDIEPFGMENFIKEIKSQTAFEIGHVLQFVLFIINVRKENQGIKLPEDIDKLDSLITTKAKEHVWFVIEEWNRRGWL